MSKEYMLDFIGSQYMKDDECLVDDCNDCNEIEECYMRANDKCNNIFAESIGYGGYDSADEFWDNL